MKEDFLQVDQGVLQEYPWRQRAQVVVTQHQGLNSGVSGWSDVRCLSVCVIPGSCLAERRWAGWSARSSAMVEIQIVRRGGRRQPAVNDLFSF